MTTRRWIQLLIVLLFIATAFAAYRIGYFMGQKDMLFRERHLTEKLLNARDTLTTAAAEKTASARAKAGEMLDRARDRLTSPSASDNEKTTTGKVSLAKKLFRKREQTTQSQ